jgi:hypothetical protein
MKWVVIRGDYNITTMDKNLNQIKVAHFLSIFL